MIDPTDIERKEKISQARNYLSYCDKMWDCDLTRIRGIEKVTAIIRDMKIFETHMAELDSRESGEIRWIPDEPYVISFYGHDVSYHNGDPYNYYNATEDLPEEYIDQFLTCLVSRLKEAAMAKAEKEFKSWEEERLAKERRREVEEFLEIRLETMNCD